MTAELTTKGKCMRCSYEFSGKTGPMKCPKCNHLYVEWLNYQEMKDAGAFDEDTAK